MLKENAISKTSKKEIPIEVLKIAYRNHRLTNYLKRKTKEELETIYSRLITNDIDESLVGIVSGVTTELEYRNQEEKEEVLSLEFLELLRRKNGLTDYLRTFKSHSQIKSMISTIYANDITEEKAVILSALLTEDEYRNQLDEKLTAYVKKTK